MIKYVILLKLRDETPSDQLKRIERQMKVVGKTIGEVAQWSSGRCLAVQEASPPWTFCAVAEFRDEEAYRRYQEHPRHQEFRDLIGPYREKVVAMHYEAHYPHPGLIKFVNGVPEVIPSFRLPPLEES